MSYLLDQWGTNPGSPADIVDGTTLQPPGDGVVDGADLGVLLDRWHTYCPCEMEGESMMMFGGGGSESLMSSSESLSSSGFNNPFYGTYLGLLLEELYATGDAEVAAEALAELLDLLNE